MCAGQPTLRTRVPCMETCFTIEVLLIKRVAPLNSSLSIMTNHSLVLAAMLVATLSTATSYLLEYPTIPEPCRSSYRDSQTIAILRVCVVTIIKTLEQLSSCFVSNLYDDHNHLRVSPTWTNGPSGTTSMAR